MLFTDVAVCSQTVVLKILVHNLSTIKLLMICKRRIFTVCRHRSSINSANVYTKFSLFKKRTAGSLQYSSIWRQSNVKQTARKGVEKNHRTGWFQREALIAVQNKRIHSVNLQFLRWVSNISTVELQPGFIVTPRELRFQLWLLIW